MNVETANGEEIRGRRETVFTGKLERVARFCRQRPLGAIGGAIFLLMIFTALAAGWIAPYSPLVNDYKAMLSPPSVKHPMGTDAHGRDVLSRIIYGSRTALLVGFSSSFSGVALGAIIGVICAYFGGKTDVIVQRLMEILLSFPLIVMALAMMAVLGTGLLNVIVAITIPMVPRSAQVIRSCVLSIRGMPYVDAARACGFGHLRVMFRHILPNVAAPILILVTAYLGGAILTEASLSFLGVGVAEPTPAWGLMLKGAAVTFAETAPWMAIFPGLAISAAVFAFNIFGDSLRDELDPKLRTS